MTRPLQAPVRRDPLRRTPRMTLPPAQRGRVALGLAAAAAEGRFALQVCADCARLQYPPREACVACSSPRLAWRSQGGEGVLLAHTRLEHSNDPYFRERLPWRVGMVRLDAGPCVMAHVHGDVAEPGPPGPPSRVRVTARLDRAGAPVLLALPLEETPHMHDDPMLREMGADPRFRKVLVTDGKSATGQALARALVDAGAERVWLGCAEPWKSAPGLEALSALPQVTPVDLDLGDEGSVRELGARIGGKVDILVSNAEYLRGGGIESPRGTLNARSEMDLHYFGLLRLAQAFAPALRARAADGVAHACAWVNVLSVYALANYPPQGTYSASMAAALSLAQGLRAQLRAGGIRVLNVFPGPIDHEWNQELPPPKLAPRALAAAVVAGLRDGVDDLYPGDVAQEWRERWRADPKGMEHELAMQGAMP